MLDCIRVIVRGESDLNIMRVVIQRRVVTSVRDFNREWHTCARHNSLDVEVIESEISVELVVRTSLDDVVHADVERDAIASLVVGIVSCLTVVDVVRCLSGIVQVEVDSAVVSAGWNHLMDSTVTDTIAISIL